MTDGQTRNRPVLRALRRRRRLRMGLIQLFYISGGLALGLALSSYEGGPTVTSHGLLTLLTGVGAGLIALIALIYSLLFLVMQFSWTTLTPRLTLFRDSPLVWHAFGFFMGVFVYTSTAAVMVGDRSEVSLYLGLVTIVLLLAVMALARALQTNALRSIQLAPTLRSIAARGAAVIDALYQDPVVERTPDLPLPPVDEEVQWTELGAYLRQVDLPRLVRLAERHACVVEVPVGVGDVVRRGAVIMRVRGAALAPSHRALRQLLEVDLDRTFAQDPLLAFRLLGDIALRALSPAVNDPTTATQAIDAIDGLLTRFADRDLDVGQVLGADDALRVVLVVPTWEDYLGIVDEIAHAARDMPVVLRRLARLFDDIAAVAPPERQTSLADRRRALDAG